MTVSAFSLFTFWRDMSNKTSEIKEKLHYYLFEDNSKADIDNIPYKDNIKILSVPEINSEYDYTNYGSCVGLHWIWKNDSSDYVGFSLVNAVPNIDKNELNCILDSNISILYAKEIEGEITLRENYRRKYYDYDMRVLIELIQRDLSYMSEYAVDEVINKCGFIMPFVIMRKDIYRKFCIWLFPILKEITKYCADKVSKRQSKYLEYLTYYLLNIYIKYNSEKFKTFEATDQIEIHFKEKPYIYPTEGTLVERVQKMVDDGMPEEVDYLLEQNVINPDYKVLKRIFDDYKRQRRYFKSANLDINKNISYHMNNDIDPQSISFIDKKPKILVLKWNSFNNDDILRALENLGLDVDYIQINNIEYARRSHNVDAINTYLDNHSFDVIFTTNYFDFLAESCYARGIPYIAWAYDSPTDVGDKSTLHYDTSHLFLFDSNEAYKYNTLEGIKNVNYMPLAADCSRYDEIIISEADKRRFSADISFVGGLYDNKLSEYLSYTDDYQKGFFNGVIDNSVGVYGSNIINDLIDYRLDKWAGSKTFYNAIFNGEKKTRSPLRNNDPSEIIGRLSVLVNKTVTNRERLILISMLSNHYDFKLYSTSSHEVFKSTTECGPVDYYNEMPKVFKCSKVNLNITLKSIKNGIPLRCLDIMGNHGFLLSNYQKDFEDRFVDGKNIALYNSLEEAFDKCKFYLEHESERKKVADAGYNTVKEYYSYRVLFSEIFKKAGLERMINR